MFSKLVRIGKDTELRFTANGKAVATINAVYDVGWGDNKRGQWIECALWGKQAEALTQYLTKGKQIVIYADDLEIESYEHNGKTGSKLKCRVVNVDLTSGGEKQEERTVRGGIDRTPTVAKKETVQDNGFSDDFDDDIPFR